ncbi:MAG: phosphatidylcholine/phosphatidylserine synthase [Planctomycetes bacterium]|nr:phosphatidylcholine/phosphatidylserine synthase [Planctomycetota bacterium]MCB9918478.1 phosphatidylcholine/phosphatidylserine synthase [Planctomycetota bacterium]
MNPEPTPRRRRRAVRRYLRRVPLLPSLLTLGNAFCGFLAIVKATDAAQLVGDGQLAGAALATVETAGLLIFLAMVFDGLDGKVARLTHQTTEFGAQLDSLADVVTFGIAPAVLAKFVISVHMAPRFADAEAWEILPYHPKIYYLFAAFYVLFAVLRLARFNVEVRDPREKSHLEFDGLPSPAAATIIGSLILFYCARNERNSISRLLFDDERLYDWLVFAMPAMLLVVGLFMVSRLPYPHLLNRVLRGRKNFAHLVAAVVLLILFVLEWQIVLFALSLLYLMSGPILGVWRFVTGKRAPVFEDLDDDDEGDEFIELDENGAETESARDPGRA